MNGQSIRLPYGAAVRFLFAAGLFFGMGGVQFAAAQDNPAPAGDTATPADAAPAPADAGATPSDAAPADAAPADAAAAPADSSAAPADAAAAPSQEPVQTIPVDTAKQEGAKDATKLDTVEVTGSRLKRTDYETAQPVVSLSREDIEKTGLTDLSQILRHLTVAGNNSLTASQGRLALTLGETNLDLRNLGATHTLLLVNGRRWVTGLISTQPSVSDYNTIPTDIIERVEVLKDGASAIYGSDAIGGVVNIITRKDFDGTGLSYQGGQYLKEGDGRNQLASASWGMTKPGSSLFINLSYTEQQRALTANRPITATSTPGTGTTRWSATTDRGRFEFIADGADQTSTFYGCPNLQSGIAAGGTGVTEIGSNNVGGSGVGPASVPAGLVLCDLARNVGATNMGNDLNDYHQKTPADVYNKYLDGSLQEPNKRTALFSQYSLDLTDHINLGIDALYNMRRSTTVGQNFPLIGGNLGVGARQHTGGISATNAFNPFAHDIGIDSSCGGNPTNVNCTGLGSGSGAWLIRLRPGRNNWLFIDKVDTMRLGANLKGDFDLFSTPMYWDGGYIYSHNQITDISPLFRFDKEDEALSATCSSTPGCVPLDVFHGQAGLTDAMLDYVFHDSYQKNQSGQNIGFVDLSFELPALSLLPGPIAVATGIEVRKDEYKSQIDPVVAQGLTILNTQQDFDGSTLGKEAYVELGVPLIKDMPFVHVLDLDLAGRYSMYKNFGNVITGKGGLRWQPVDDLLVRTTYSTGFRAPNVAELFLPPSQSYDPLKDPCADPAAAEPTATNCQPYVVGAQNDGLVAQPYDLWQGSSNLKPEKSKNLTYGIVYSPHQIPDLNFNLDFYKIDIDKYITVGTGQYFMDQCYTTVGPSSPYCGNIKRDPSGTLQYIITPYINLGGLGTTGYDFGMDFVVPLGENAGDLKVQIDTSYLGKFNYVNPDNSVVGVVGTDTGLFAGFPRWKAGSELTWKKDLWTASWATRMAYKMTEPCNDIYGDTDPTVSYANLGLCTDAKYDKDGKDVSTNTMKTVLYHNLQIARDLPQYNTDITIGVNNVLNQDPPISYSMIGFYWYNYDPNQYEVPGRFGYLKLSYKF